MTGIQEIARETGLSKSTVSRALRGLSSVTPETTITVQRAADRLGYIASSAAAGLATGRNRTIGVLVPVIDRWFYIAVLEGIDAELRRAGYDLVLYSLGGPVGDRDRFFHRSILRKRIDALVVLCLLFDDDEREQLHQMDLPVVVVGGPGPGVRHVGIDDRRAATEAVRHLLEIGHRRIAHIGGEDELGMNRAVPVERREGYRDALGNAGIDVRDDWMVDGEFSFDGGSRAMRSILSLPGQRPTAVFAASDEMALGAMAAISELGLKVPEDISVIGIDGHQYGAPMGLTTIAQNPYDQGVEATRALLAELDGAATVDDFAPAPFTLVVRRSTAPPAAD
ncbi:LacI family DNA-binding transcriptional regulator [Lacisediminihabitans changchengi]|uniref:LacI family DNA-binding transcriptional regulator n=1 Tax=Lacisediminihabitans changchengi TaxID=2787634 RepID=A0A934W2X9_9MICO|nr:LacI family DNA-binding transcriptional regulator [Lacisediminihabitans changchengi]MBK4347311.1 LacI family DNA-binding transcriptional regulator [Lacisediminihabitans changchengi]